MQINIWYFRQLIPERKNYVVGEYIYPFIWLFDFFFKNKRYLFIQIDRVRIVQIDRVVWIRESPWSLVNCWGHYIIYAGVEVWTPSIPHIHFKKCEFIAIRLLDKKIKVRIFEQTHNIHVNRIKLQHTYAYKYDYIHVFVILMFSGLQRRRRLNHWVYFHSIKTSIYLNQINTALRREIKKKISNKICRSN